MAVRNSQSKKPRGYAAELAVAALDGNSNPLDADMSGIDPSPTSLNLYGSQEAMCSDPRRSRLGLEACIVCGESPSEDCD